VSVRARPPVLVKFLQKLGNFELHREYPGVPAARRAREAVAGLPAGLVFDGFSLGAVHAELLAASRPGALGAVLMHGAVPVEGLSEFFGLDRWPEGVPVQVHYAAGDPWVEAEEEVVPLGDAVRATGAAFEEHTYPGSGHLFADPDLPEYDRASSEEMWERVLGFLDRIDARGSGVESGPGSRPRRCHPMSVPLRARRMSFVVATNFCGVSCQSWLPIIQGSL
jgi:hypothetical protein